MMQALRQFSEQLGLFLDGFGDCHGWVPSVVRADYGTSRILPICSLGSISRCAAAARAAKTGEKVNGRSLPVSQIGQTFFAGCGDLTLSASFWREQMQQHACTEISATRSARRRGRAARVGW